MKKGIIVQAGLNCYVIQLKINVTRDVFAVAIADYFEGEDSSVIKEMSKPKAKKILEQQLALYGIEGVDGSEWDQERVSEWESIKSKALKWIDSNYPWLKEN